MTPQPDPLLPFRMPWRGLWTATRAALPGMGIAMLSLFLIFAGFFFYVAIMMWLHAMVVGELDRRYRDSRPTIRFAKALLPLYASKSLAMLFYVLLGGWLLGGPLAPELNDDLLAIFAGACLAGGDMLAFAWYVHASVGRFVSRTWWLAGVLWLALATCSLWAGVIYLTLWYFPLGALIPPLMLWIFALWAALPWLLLQARHPEDIEAPDEAPVPVDIGSSS